jgi:hypothetical protein
MAKKELQGEFGVCRVVFRAAGDEGAAIPCQGRRLNRKNYKEIVLQQRRDEWALAELEAHRNRRAAKALSEESRWSGFP